MSQRQPRVLIVEDSIALAETYAAYLDSNGYEVVLAATGQEALSRIGAGIPDVVVLDVHLPDMDGLDILRRIKAEKMPSEVVVITAQASVKLAVDAMRQGAFDFVMKPFNAERLRVTVRNAVERAKTAAVIDDMQETFGRERFVGFIGNSLAMQPAYRILQSAAPTNATVFVTGESGTGKELCAEALHKLSKRANGPLVTINCAAIPKDMLESEIFGHIKGAYTGATADRKGAALQADGGTLFLDEIGEMDLTLQAKMLRFLQTKQVQRLGEDLPRATDVRIVCATNRDPMAEVAAGRFREDLFYRLHVVPVELPPLRNRDDDVLLIARHFLAQFSAEDGRSFKGFTPEAEQALLAYPWPGNVRQLQNVVRNVVVLNEAERVGIEMLPKEIRVPRGGEAPAASPTAAAVPAAASPATAVADATVAEAGDEFIRPLEAVIRQTIETAIARSGGSIPRAAAALEVSPSTIYRRMEAWKADDAVNGRPD
ncbi:MAG: sigma-54-dependent Fis family transcriptional regulator [Hyphomicrobiaceae bacterium]|nr:sigma-54-dependent Fis family transcriptional regulator [Hyphomicrobiaceae bacterium]